MTGWAIRGYGDPEKSKYPPVTPQTCLKSNFSFYLVKTSLVLPTNTRQLTSIKSFYIRHDVLIRKWANFQSCCRVKKFHRIDFQGTSNQYTKFYENLSPKPSLGSYLKSETYSFKVFQGIGSNNKQSLNPFAALARRYLRDTRIRM